MQCCAVREELWNQATLVDHVDALVDYVGNIKLRVSGSADFPHGFLNMVGQSVRTYHHADISLR